MPGDCTTCWGTCGSGWGTGMGTIRVGAVTDPTGPRSGSARVIRGGSWGDYAGNCRSAYRYGNSPGNRNRLPRLPPAEAIITLGPITLLPLAVRSARGWAGRREGSALQRPNRAENRPPAPFFHNDARNGSAAAPRERGRLARILSIWPSLSFPVMLQGGVLSPGTAARAA